MVTLEHLTLSGAMTLLTYLQYARISDETIQPEAVIGTLCEMLSQLETNFPGVTEAYGWAKAENTHI